MSASEYTLIFGLGQKVMAHQTRTLSLPSLSLRLRTPP